MLTLAVRLTAQDDGFAGTIQLEQAALDKLNTAAARAGQGMQSLAANENRAASAGSAQAAQAKAQATATGQLTARTAAHTRALGGMHRQTNAVTDGFTRLRRVILALGLAAAVRATVTAAADMQAITSGLTLAAGAAQGASGEMAFLREEAERLGLNLRRTAGAYASLTAAASGTSLQGQASREIFLGVSEAMTALGRDSVATEGALRAIEQMISKGNVQAEELRGQLGERLPGAFQIAARAMGVTTSELNDMLEAGDVLAEDLLPKLAAELRATFGAQAMNQARGARAEINRFSNAIFELQVAAADSGFLAGFTDGLRALTEALAQGQVREAAAELGRAIGAAFRFAGEAVKFLADNMDLVKAAIAALVAAKVATMFVGITRAIMATVAAGGLLNAVLLANPIVAVAAAFVAAATLVYENWDDIRQFFVDLWADIRALFTAGSIFIAGKFQAAVLTIKSWIRSLQADMLDLVTDPDSVVGQILRLTNPAIGQAADLVAQNGNPLRAQATEFSRQAQAMLARDFASLFENYRSLYRNEDTTGSNRGAGAPGLPGFTPTTGTTAPDITIGGLGGTVGSGAANDNDAADRWREAWDEAVDHFRDRAREAAALTESLRTPMEVYGDTVADLTSFLEDGFITQETFNRGLAEADKLLQDATGSTIDWAGAWKDIGSLAGKTLSDIRRRTFDAAQALESLADIIFRVLVIQPFESALSSIDIGGIFNDLFSTSTAHTGGVIGARGLVGGTDSRVVSLDAFRNAPRFKRGGQVGLAPGEVPIVAHEGEVIGWPNQMRRAFGGGGDGGLRVVVEDHRRMAANDSGGPPIGISEGMGPDGERQVRVMVFDAFTDLVESGQMHAVMASAYGVRPQGAG